MMEDHRCRLVLVSPAAPEPGDFCKSLTAAFAGGDVATLILALDSDDPQAWIDIADFARPLAIEAGAAFLIRDQIARLEQLDADGIHVEAGRDDIMAIAKSLQPKKIVGAGAIFNRHTAMRAGESGADYIFFGRTGLNPDDRKAADIVKKLTEWWYPLFQVPSIAFAATIEDAAELARSGADFVALGNAVWDHPDGAETATRDLNQLFESLTEGL